MNLTPGQTIRYRVRNRGEILTAEVLRRKGKPMAGVERAKPMGGPAWECSRRGWKSPLGSSITTVFEKWIVEEGRC